MTQRAKLNAAQVGEIYRRGWAGAAKRALGQDASRDSRGCASHAGALPSNARVQCAHVLAGPAQDGLALGVADCGER